MNWERVKELFADALDREPAERPAFLDAACAGDTELRAEVDSLLATHDTTGDFIEKPAARHALGLGLNPPEEAPNWIGRRVGDYRIVEEVGRGRGIQTGGDRADHGRRRTQPPRQPATRQWIMTVLNAAPPARGSWGFNSRPSLVAPVASLPTLLSPGREAP